MAMKRKAQDKPKPQQPKYLDDDHTSWLIRDVRMAAHIEEEQIGAIAEGALLAAEQVQDTRIALLENPQPSELEIIMNILITVALESTVAGALLPALLKRSWLGNWKAKTTTRIKLYNTKKTELAKANKNFTDSVLRMNNLHLNPPNLQKETMTKVCMNAMEDAAESLQKLTAAEIGAAEVFAVDRHTALLHKGLEFTVFNQQNIAAVEQGIGAGYLASQVPRTEAGELLLKGSSPGVSLIMEIYQWATDARLAHRADHEFDEYLLRLGDVTPELAQEIESKLGGGGSSEIGILRQEMMMFSEAVIWARLYQKKKSVDFKSSGVKATYQVIDAPNQLYEYWETRFKDAVVKYKKMEPYNWDKQPPVHKKVLISEYFIKINMKTSDAVEFADKALKQAKSG